MNSDECPNQTRADGEQPTSELAHLVAEAYEHATDDLRTAVHNSLQAGMPDSALSLEVSRRRSHQPTVREDDQYR